MSDLAATNCGCEERCGCGNGCGNSCGNNGWGLTNGSSCNCILWIIILYVLLWQQWMRKWMQL